MTRETKSAWPDRPSWGFAAFVILLSCLGIVVVWYVNYRQAFGG
jgi:hypothetical protein